jgi:hypothetical protein
MGTVYLAFDLKLQRSLALKIPDFDRHAHPDLLKRFRREARVAAAFDHPNLCPVYDFDRAGEHYYLTMPFIEGRPLATLLDRGPLVPLQAATIIRTLALALADAHRRGVVHRDLKPSNVMITRQGKLVIMDFGIARLTAATDSLQTGVGMLLGTPAYMAPEQVEPSRHPVGPWTDIYSLGVMFYQLLTARLPFIGHANWVCVQVLHDEPARPGTLRPELDPALEAVCLRAMKKRPEERYASMEEMAAALEPAVMARAVEPSAPPAPTPLVLATRIDGETWSRIRLGPPTRAPRPLRRVSGRLAFVAGLVLIGWMAVGRGTVVAPDAGATSYRGAPAPAVAVRKDETRAARLLREPEPRDKPAATAGQPAARDTVASAKAEPPVDTAKTDVQSDLSGLRTELRDAYRRADPAKPAPEIPRLWNAIHALQARLDVPAATVLVKVRRSKTPGPLVLYCDEPGERRRETRLQPGAVEVLTPAMPAAVTYVLHGPHPGDDGPRSVGGPGPFAVGPPFPPADPPPLWGGPPAPGLRGPRPLSARRLDLKNREVVLEFEFSTLSGRWKHHLHVAAPATPSS